MGGLVLPVRTLVVEDLLAVVLLAHVLPRDALQVECVALDGREVVEDLRCLLLVLQVLLDDLLFLCTSDFTRFTGFEEMRVLRVILVDLECTIVHVFLLVSFNVVHAHPFLHPDSLAKLDGIVLEDPAFLPLPYGSPLNRCHRFLVFGCRFDLDNLALRLVNRRVILH